jgi:chromatin segregation and condensation protein Rec8/ScpA/Scc1 (kleisin family)
MKYPGISQDLKNAMVRGVLADGDDTRAMDLASEIKDWMKAKQTELVAEKLRLEAERDECKEDIERLEKYEQAKQKLAEASNALAGLMPEQVDAGHPTLKRKIQNDVMEHTSIQSCPSPNDAGDQLKERRKKIKKG